MRSQAFHSTVRDRRTKPQTERRGGRDGQRDRADGAGPALPRLRRAHADEGRDGRREGDGVVLVEDAGHQREGQARDERASHPRRGMRRARVSVRGARPRRHRPAASRMRAAGMSQEIWPPMLGVEHAAADRSRPSGAAAATADRAGLVAADPAEAVVAEGQLEERVVLAAADVGPHARGHELDDGDPPAGRQDHRADRRGATCQIRLRSVVSARRRGRPGRSRARRGRTCRVLVRKPRPMKTPTTMNHFGEACSIDFIVAQAPSAMSSVSSASGLLNRNISTATGVSAMTAPAMRPAAGAEVALDGRVERRRRVATPMSDLRAGGSRRSSARGPAPTGP